MWKLSGFSSAPLRPCSARSRAPSASICATAAASGRRAKNRRSVILDMVRFLDEGRLSGSFPLDGRGRLAAHVVGHAVDAAHLVDDAARGALEQAVGQLGPVRGHEVAGL
eukprot:Opistho-2@94833